MLATIRAAKTRMRDRLAWQAMRRRLPSAFLCDELSLETWGGELFVADINGDGVEEFLWLQTAGIFKSKLYLKPTNQRRRDWLTHETQRLFCLTATDQTGKILWQIGEPWPGQTANDVKCPYLSHAAENMLACADIDMDGAVEVLVLDSEDRLIVLDGTTGLLKKSIPLPADNFANVFCSPGNEKQDTRIIVGVTDQGYSPAEYGNPWLILDGSLNTICEGSYKGAGHSVVIDDVNGDGRDEFLIGYQLVRRDGRVEWTADVMRDRQIRAVEEHVDHSLGIRIDGEWFAAIAGSDCQYWLDSNGIVRWATLLPHPQFCLLGTYASERRIFVFNQRACMYAFNLDGKELWRGLLPECWPIGRPTAAHSARPIHTNRPALVIHAPFDHQDDLIVYAEGGWPYLVDFNGSLRGMLPVPSNARPLHNGLNYPRINDIGLSYEVRVPSASRQQRRVVVYNRRFAWLFDISTCFV